MENDSRYLEENVARLVRSGLAPEARPDPVVRERTWQLLRTQLSGKRSVIEFPERLLGLLVAALVLMALWLAIQVLGVAAVGATSTPFVAIIVALLALNLLGIPVASMVIVLRRRHV